MVRITPPQAGWIPVVLDSPHSGTRFPDDFNAIASTEALRAGVDAFVDQLFPGPAHGAIMIAAEFPRAYIDPNRPLDDLDPAIIASTWPAPLTPSNKSGVGAGLIWTQCMDGTPIYSRPLPGAVIKARIEQYWRPYRTTLTGALDDAHARAGAVWHINCHSMPSIWPAGVAGEGLPVEADFLLGDRDGTTCAPEMTALVKEVLTGYGYRVAVNDRFKGVDIVRNEGRPTERRHSLQIEVVRSRYMDEPRWQPADGFDAVQAALGEVVRALGEYAGRTA
ncbi:MAG: N-formylglutamate amidohydrolase [Gammaproteobacteria bacterium]|nr:N-formylglutamate amidohydrolase [Gammaproteobacteria bacterium]